MSCSIFTILLLTTLSVSCFSQEVMEQPIDSIQNEIVKEFKELDDWIDCYQRIIDQGNDMPNMEDCYKTNQNLVNGCSCQVWVYANMEDGLLYYHSYADALVLNGLVSLLIRVLNGHYPKEILNTKLYFIEASGLDQHLSPTRYRDLLKVFLYMRKCARRLVIEQETAGNRGTSTTD